MTISPCAAHHPQNPETLDSSPPCPFLCRMCCVPHAVQAPTHAPRVPLPRPLSAPSPCNGQKHRPVYFYCMLLPCPVGQSPLDPPHNPRAFLPAACTASARVVSGRPLFRRFFVQHAQPSSSLLRPSMHFHASISCSACITCMSARRAASSSMVILSSM